MGKDDYGLNDPTDVVVIGMSILVIALIGIVAIVGISIS